MRRLAYGNMEKMDGGDLTFDDGEPARTNGQVYQAIRNINRDCSNRSNSDKRLIENLGGGVYKINQESP